jgi:hypothetical protein
LAKHFRSANKRSYCRGKGKRETNKSFEPIDKSDQLVVLLQAVPLTSRARFHENKAIDTIKADNIELDRALRDELPSLPRLYPGKERVPGVPGRRPAEA